MLAPELWEKFHILVPLKVFNVNHQIIRGKMAVLVAKATKYIKLRNVRTSSPTRTWENTDLKIMCTKS